ncbi:MAG TPA: NUDIX domain-containing protein [Geminicoccaceae bacterium]
MPKRVDIVERRRVHDGFFKLDVLKLRHELFAGGMSELVTRELWVQRNAVTVLPYDPERDAVVLIEQFRTGAVEAPEGPWLTEGVAGLLDEGESPEQTAAREVREECGLELGRLDLAGVYIASPGSTSERVHAYVGEVEAPPPGDGDMRGGLATEHEDILARVVPADEAIAMFRQGRIVAANTVIPLQHLMLNRERLRREWRRRPGPA